MKFYGYFRNTAKAKKDNGQSLVVQFGEMGKVRGFRRKGDQQSVYRPGREVLRIGDFPFEGLVALGDDDIISFSRN